MERREWLKRVVGVGVAVAAVALNRQKMWVVLKTTLTRATFDNDDQWGLDTGVYDAQTGENISRRFPLRIAGTLRRNDIATVDLYRLPHRVEHGEVSCERACVIVTRRETA